MRIIYLFIYLLIITFLFLNYTIYRKTRLFYQPVEKKEDKMLNDDALLANDNQTYFYRRLEKKKDLENKNTVKMFIIFIFLALAMIFLWKIIKYYQQKNKN